MAAIDLGQVTGAGLYTQTAAAWTTKLQVPAASMVAGGKYLVIVTAMVGGDDNAADDFRCRVALATTGIEDSVHRYESRDTGSTFLTRIYAWWGIVDQPGGGAEDVNFQMYEGAAATAYARNVTIWHMRLDDDLAENTHWVYAEHSTPATHTTSLVTRASKTFTPPVAGHDWAVLGKARVAVNNTTVGIETVLDPGAYSLDSVSPQTILEGEDVAEEIPFMLQWGLEAAAAESQTVSIETRDDDAATQNQYLSSAVFAVDLDVFESHAFIVQEAPVSPDESAWDQLASDTYTPATTGDQAILADARYDVNSSSNNGRNRLQFDGATVPTGWDDDVSMGPNDSGDELNRPVAIIREIDTDGETIDLDGFTNYNTPGMTFEDGLIILFSAELAVTGTDVTVAGVFPEFTAAATITSTSTVTVAGVFPELTAETTTVSSSTVTVTGVFPELTMSASTTCGPIPLPTPTLSRFYRIIRDGVPNLVLVPVGLRVRAGTHTAEGFETVSGRFVHNTSFEDAIMASMATVWDVHQLADQATLTAAVNTALQGIGYRGPGGIDLA